MLFPQAGHKKRTKGTLLVPPSNGQIVDLDSGQPVYLVVVGVSSGAVAAC